MTGTKTYHKVDGRTFMVWSDFVMRATYAQEIGSMEMRRIHGGGYLSNELSIRKAIANTFGLKSFRKA